MTISFLAKSKFLLNLIWASLCTCDGLNTEQHLAEELQNLCIFTMKLVGVVVAFLAINLASALLPGNSASRLPYQVETPQDQNNPVQFRAYTFAIKYPFGNIQHDDTPTTYDAQVQQAAGEKEKKW